MKRTFSCESKKQVEKFLSNFNVKVFVIALPPNKRGCVYCVMGIAKRSQIFFQAIYFSLYGIGLFMGYDGNNVVRGMRFIAAEISGLVYEAT